MKYFLHDANAFNDEKITELFMEFGYEGLGLFYTILEKIALQEKPVKTSVLKQQLSVGKKLEKCWKFMESIGLICSNNGETFNEQLLKYSEKYQVKKQKNAEKIKSWRDRQDVTKNVTGNEPVRNAPKVNKSKVKLSKVKESKEERIAAPVVSENDNEGPKEKAPQVPADPPLIYPWDTESFKQAWKLWKKYKKEQKKFTFKSQITEQIALKELTELSNGREETAIRIIQKSIASGWAGLFRLSEEKGKSVTADSLRDSDDFIASLSQNG